MTVARSKEVATLYEEIADWFDGQRSQGGLAGERFYLELALKHAPAGGTVLDLGCGTGKPIAQFFIERGLSVTGVDASPRMVALCKQHFPDSDWRVGDIRALDLQKRFSIVLAWDSFFHLDHAAQREMFRIFGAHTAPGGTLLFTSGSKHGEIYGTMEGREFYHSSLNPQEYRNLLEKHGFQVILHKIEDPNCGEHTVWVAQKNL